MFLDNPLFSSRLYYRTLTAQDAEGNYQHWLHNPVVNQYLEVRHNPPTLDELKQFITQNNASADNLLLGIFLSEHHQHIGNIKIGPIDWRHQRAIIGLLIGEPSCWNKGYASETIQVMTQYCIEHLKLNRVMAGCYQANIGSYRAFKKAGYVEEARQAKYWRRGLTYEDNIIMCFLSRD